MGTKSSQPLRKCPKITYQAKEDDPFGRLPEEIIVFHILSRLTLQEAFKSSLLSRRWKNLWIDSIGSKLIFSHTIDTSLFPSNRGNNLNRLRRVLASGLSHVLESYPKPTLDELKVCFDFDSSSSDAIDSWIEYAFRKGVTRLELDLSPFDDFHKVRYAFPGLEKLSALHVFCDSHLLQPVRCAGINNLRDICLKEVNVSSEIIEFMLSSCPSLERLCVCRSWLRTRVKVSGQSIKLKSLEFDRCIDTKIQISSSNLVSLRYSGATKALRIESIPLLSELSIGGKYCRSFLRSRCQNFKFIAQLKRLTLHLSSEIVTETHLYPLEFPELIKLEQLEVIMKGYGDSCLLWPIVLIKAAPFLHKFCVQLLTLKGMRAKMKPKEKYVSRLRKATKLVHHQCLKIIEIRTYCGCRYEVELAEHLLGISQSLEQVVVQPWLPTLIGRVKRKVPQEDVEDCKREYGKKAKELKKWLPPGADLLVL